MKKLLTMIENVNKTLLIVIAGFAIAIVFAFCLTLTISYLGNFIGQTWALVAFVVLWFLYFGGLYLYLGHKKNE